MKETMQSLVEPGCKTLLVGVIVTWIGFLWIVFQRAGAVGAVRAMVAVDAVALLVLWVLARPALREAS
jgi:hypothetical protein